MNIQTTENQITLELIDRIGKGRLRSLVKLRGRLAGHHWTDRVRAQMSGIQFNNPVTRMSLAERFDSRSGDGVFQFAYITGPAVTLKPATGFLIQSKPA